MILLFVGEGRKMGDAGIAEYGKSGHFKVKFRCFLGEAAGAGKGTRVQGKGFG
jgi:hypothetical protein